MSTTNRLEAIGVSKERYSVMFLQKCIELQRLKGQDYQNPNSRVKQADYYPSGIKTIEEIIHAKKLRLQSLIETWESNNNAPVFESVEDTLMDMVNYASFMAAFINREIDGQDLQADVFNRKLSEEEESVQ